MFYKAIRLNAKKSQKLLAEAKEMYATDKRSFENDTADWNLPRREVQMLIRYRNARKPLEKLQNSNKMN